MTRRMPELSILRQTWSPYSDPRSTHTVQVGKVRVGGARPIVIAGPCAVESLDQTLEIAHAIKRAGADLLRGGAFKPITSPHSFQGLGIKGLEILSEVRRITGLGIVTEVMDPRLVSEVAEVADILQIGSRSMQNFPLLTEVGRAGRPVLLKRAWSATLEEWLCAAEYIAVQGNRNIILCERGIRTSCHWEYSRNILDLNVIKPLRQATPLPVIVDPSHATGQAHLVPVMSQAALAAGAQGLLIEVIAKEASRVQARCDGEQGIFPEELEQIVALTHQGAPAASFNSAASLVGGLAK